MKGKKEILVGLFAIVALGALVWGFFFLKGKNIFGDAKEYVVVYSNTNGLTANSAVKLNGVKVGAVTYVDIDSSDYSRSIVRFTLTNENIKLTKGTIAELNADVLGTAALELTIKPNINGYHSLGDTLIGTIAIGIQQAIEDQINPLKVKIEELLGTTENAINNIDTIFGGLNTGSLNRSILALESSMKNINEITYSINGISSTLDANKHKIIETVDNVNSITKNIAASNSDISDMITNINDFSATLSKVDLAGISTQTSEALTNVNLIIDEIQNGDGTLTKLMQDSLLYDNINNMIVEATDLVSNIKFHPNRYLQFAVFGGKDKGVLTRKEEKKLQQFAKDSLD
ncbi:MAG: phospholipid/cholesterol/gamma-HCH transport system substrate-binding protein [Flavobacteriales bacterium]|jgi:phospholipid/cholesterol/gamma-HCH transport system substrate-binding protein